MNSYIAINLDSFGRWLAAHRVRRDEARTQRFLASLPEDIRKDIGWPDTQVSRAPARAAATGWDAETFLARTECRLG